MFSLTRFVSNSSLNFLTSFLSRYIHFSHIELVILINESPFGRFIVCLQSGNPEHAMNRLPLVLAILTRILLFRHYGHVENIELSNRL